MKERLDKFAVYVLFACIIAALTVAIILTLKYPTEKQTYNIELTVKTDTLGILTRESQAMMDSVIHVVANQNRVLQGKYETMADHETDNLVMVKIGGILVTVIVSILGFFGFRSFKSIEEIAVNNAEGAAKKKLDDEMGAEIERVKRTLETEIVKKFDDDIKPKVKTEVVAEINERYNNDLSAKINFININNEVINSLKNDVESLKNKFSVAQDEGLAGNNEAVTATPQPKPEDDDIVQQIRNRRVRKSGTTKEEKGGKS